MLEAGTVLGKVVLQPIGRPEHDFASTLAVFESALHHEQTVTRAINAMKKLRSFTA